MDIDMPEHDEEKTGRPLSPIEEKHPHIVEWVQSYGWIEIGWDENTRSFLKAIECDQNPWGGSTTVKASERWGILWQHHLP